MYLGGGLSQELLDPQMWYTYQNFHYFHEKMNEGISNLLSLSQKRMNFRIVLCKESFRRLFLKIARFNQFRVGHLEPSSDHSLSLISKVLSIIDSLDRLTFRNQLMSVMLTMPTGDHLYPY